MYDLRAGGRREQRNHGNSAMTYRPGPIETTEVTLSPDLHELVERLAESNHDHWAQQRIREGWSYGSERDDERKTHPDLLPYDELSESEKEYDRGTPATSRPHHPDAPAPKSIVLSVQLLPEREVLGGKVDWRAEEERRKQSKEQQHRGSR